MAPAAEFYGQRVLDPSETRQLDRGCPFPPAWVWVEALGRHLAWSPPAATLLFAFGAVPPAERNYVRMVFTDPATREIHS